jgi:hypothetical protein
VLGTETYRLDLTWLPFSSLVRHTLKAATCKQASKRPAQKKENNTRSKKKDSTLHAAGAQQPTDPIIPRQHHHTRDGYLLPDDWTSCIRTVSFASVDTSVIRYKALQGRNHLERASFLPPTFVAAHTHPHNILALSPFFLNILSPTCISHSLPSTNFPLHLSPPHHLFSLHRSPPLHRTV